MLLILFGNDDDNDASDNDDDDVGLNDTVLPMTSFVRSQSAHATLPTSPTRPVEDRKQITNNNLSKSSRSPPRMPGLGCGAGSRGFSASARVPTRRSRSPTSNSFGPGRPTSTGGEETKRTGLRRQMTAPLPQQQRQQSVSHNKGKRFVSSSAPVTPSSNNNFITSPRSSSPNVISNNNSFDRDPYNRTMQLLNDALPLPRDYFCAAIRCLMMDTPLPMVGHGGGMLSSLDNHEQRAGKASCIVRYPVWPPTKTTETSIALPTLPDGTCLTRSQAPGIGTAAIRDSGSRMRMPSC